MWACEALCIALRLKPMAIQITVTFKSVSNASGVAMLFYNVHTLYCAV